jgi:hypothetical protein
MRSLLRRSPLVALVFIPSSHETRPGEGMQVVNITTKSFSGDVLVMNNEHCGKNGKGGVSFWDVTDPRKPYRLSTHFGDRANLSRGDANDITAPSRGTRATRHTP